MRFETNAENVERQFMNATALFDIYKRQIIKQTALTLQGRIRKNASTGFHTRESRRRGHIPGTGPGPNVATGNYRRSVQVSHELDGSTVHTNAPQAKRLEYGFRGADSIGRTYNQPPYPHWQPAVKAMEPVFEQEILDALRKAIRDAGQ